MIFTTDSAPAPTVSHKTRVYDSNGSASKSFYCLHVCASLVITDHAVHSYDALLHVS